MIYLDNAASTRPYDEVIEYLTYLLKENYANPSAIHNYGYTAEKLILDSQKGICEYFNCKPENIIYTSGGTESNNYAIFQGVKINRKNTGKHIITSSIEHSSVKKVFDKLSEEGYDVTYLNVNKYGIIDIDELKDALREDTNLVSIMAVNNEIGSINPIDKIGEIIKSYNKDILFHVDGVQAFTKIDFHLSNVDLYSVSGHKIHATKGVGLLYTKTNKLTPMIIGGGQQRDMRSGTVNMPMIVAMNKAFDIRISNKNKIDEKIHKLKEYFILKLSDIDDIKINSPLDISSDYICSVTFRNVSAEILLRALEMSEHNIIVSAGASCSSKAKLASSTIVQIGGTSVEANSTVRFSFNEFITFDDLDNVIEVLKREVIKLRKLVRK